VFAAPGSAGGIGGWIEKEALHGVVVEIEGGSVQG
jgi:hypothetical protein